ncbi:ATP-dependent zinc metalloprotease FtsH [Ghiorsea bivora]|uniref:ATP-dependent zinc metalloprotease FtsH n=1 Tax=Ghiorsea bivora TaxID=1485545 RepID=UPI00068B6133|nr:ATP-dependent zinc metalloprotease FtsH [Ghiorsea bivora]
MNKNLLLWIVIGMTMMSIFNMFSAPMGKTQPLSYTAFIEKVDQGLVDDVTIQDKKAVGHYRDMSGNVTRFELELPDDPSLVQRLIDNKVEVKASHREESMFLTILISWFPMLLLIGVWIFFMRQMQGGGKGGAMGFGKSKAKLLTEHKDRVTFEDVAGCDEAKQEVTEVIEFLRDPTKFTRLGGKIPKGILLVGPPGTGKTLLGRAIAGEAEVPFYSISGSDFVEMFVGVGASRVRDMFEQAKKHAPCIIFVDEIDAMGRHRGAGIGGGNDEREQTLNQLLVEMDGFEANEGVILVAATNRPDVLDPALLRPGRFDRQVVVGNPDMAGRVQILKVHMKKVPLSSDVDVQALARGTPGFSGADLANLVNEAALSAARYNRDKVTNQDFEESKDKVMMGAERKSMAMTDEEKALTAYHEAGHALVGIHSPKHDPLHKVTIIPRGRALGVTMNLPERDRLSQSRIELESRLASLFGGRMAEELVFGPENITTGAGHDIQQATKIARAMVTEYGFSERLGRLRFSENEEEVFLGRSVTQNKHVSDATALIIDEEIRAFVDIAEEKARKILTDHRDELEIIAQALLEYETLSGKEVSALLRGEKLQRPVDQSTFSSNNDDTGEEDIAMDAGEEKHEPKDGKETGQES